MIFTFDMRYDICISSEPIVGAIIPVKMVIIAKNAIWVREISIVPVEWEDEMNFSFERNAELRTKGS